VIYGLRADEQTFCFQNVIQTNEQGAYATGRVKENPKRKQSNTIPEECADSTLFGLICSVRSASSYEAMRESLEINPVEPRAHDDEPSKQSRSPAGLIPGVGIDPVMVPVCIK